MKRLRKIAQFCAVICLLSILAVAGTLMYLAHTRLPNLDGIVTSEKLLDEVSVIRDASGVPHIDAQNETDAYFALGYCMAQDRLFQMELMRRLARGELAEVLGPPLVKVDRILRAFRLRAKAEEYFAHSETRPPEVLALMDAFVDGVNAFIADGPLPFEFAVLHVDARPFTKVDCLSVAAILPITFADGIREDPLVTMLKQKHPDMDIDALFPGYSKGIPVTIMESLDEAKAYLGSRPPKGKTNGGKAPQLFLASLDGFRDWFAVLGGFSERFGPAMGSNSWVLAPSRTASGKAILANDPHIVFTNPGIWYEAYLKYGDVENYGFHLPPIPVPLLGHNRDRGWALSMFANDDVDFYVEQFDPNDPARVKYKGQWVTAETVTETIKVRFGKDVRCEVRITPHGPILTDFLEAYHHYQGAPVSLSWVWQHVEYTDIVGFYRMGRARTYDDFAAAVALVTSPGVNISYADKDGTIAWWAAGKIPIRPAHVNSKQMLDGASGKDELLGYLPFDRNPHLKNPACGFIATANNLSTVKPVGPIQRLQGYWQPDDRAGRIEQLVGQRSDWTLEELKAVQFDDTGYATPKVLASLLEVLTANEAALNPLELDALKHLQDWDLRHNIESTGAALYEHWCGAVLHRALADEMGEDLFKVYCTLADHWNFFKYFVVDNVSPFWDDLATPGRETRAEIVVAAFQDTTASLTKRYGNDVSTWTWGRAHTMEFKHPFGRLPLLDRVFNLGPYPAAGGAQTIDNMLYNFGQDEYDVVAGPSVRRLIDFSEPEKSWAILPTGNSGNFMSPHYGDQAERFMRGEYRQALMAGEDIAAQTMHELHFLPGSR